MQNLFTVFTAWHTHYIVHKLQLSACLSGSGDWDTVHTNWNGLSEGARFNLQNSQ